MGDTKTCFTCKKALPYADFQVKKQRSDGYSSWCKNCTRIKVADIQRKWREENKEKVAEQDRKWREKNKEKIAEKDRKWREKNKEKIAEKCHKWYEENKERVAEQGRKWYEDNYCKWREKNKEKIAEHNKRYVQKNKERCAEKNVKWGRTSRAEFKDCYVRSILKQQKFEQCDITPELIEAKREQLRLRRLVVQLQQAIIEVETTEKETP